MHDFTGTITCMFALRIVFLDLGPKYKVDSMEPRYRS